VSLGHLTSVEGADELRRRVLWSVPTPLAVLGCVSADGDPHLMNVSWVTPAAHSPTRLVFSVESSARANALLHETASFAVSLLDVEQRTLGRAFVKPHLEWSTAAEETIAGYPIARSARRAPFLQSAVAVLAGEAAMISDLGSHHLWLGTVEEVASTDAIVTGPASANAVRILGVHDTRMNYGD